MPFHHFLTSINKPFFITSHSRKTNNQTTEKSNHKIHIINNKLSPHNEKIYFLILFTLFFFTAQSFGSMKKSKSLLPKSNQVKTDTVIGAPIPKEIEDPQNIGINKEPAHATLMPYASLEEALKANRHASSFCRSLNGPWKFNWVTRPEYRPVDFYKPSYRCFQMERHPRSFKLAGTGLWHTLLQKCRLYLSERFSKGNDRTNQ